ncbi:MAG: alpha/beta hydrolase [Planctomycetota bacterium]
MLLVTLALCAFPPDVRPATAEPVELPSGGTTTCAVVGAASLATATPEKAESKDDPVGELARMETRDKIRLEATFYPVPRAKDPLPAVLLIHDLGSDRSQLVPLVEKLLKEKLCVLAIDLRGHGTSATEDLDWSKLEEVQRERLTPFMRDDVNAALDWLTADSRVIGTRIGIVGQGFGGLLGLRAARDERIVNLTMIEPALEDHGYRLSALLPDAEGLPMQIVVGKDEEQPIDDLIKSENIDYVEMRTVKAERGALFEDKRLAAALGKWIDTYREGAQSQGGFRMNGAGK